jgi:NADPH:quinone reductase-like Zn-dependent oxidoreductase
MRVVRAAEFGGPEVLVPGKAPEPAAGPGQVVVEVSIAPVLFLDTPIRSGLARAWFPVTMPYVPGRGVAGQVSSVGAGVDPDWVGRRVVADTAEGGGYLERAVVAVDGLIAVPEGLGDGRGGRPAPRRQNRREPHRPGEAEAEPGRGTGCGCRGRLLAITLARASPRRHRWSRGGHGLRRRGRRDRPGRVRSHGTRRPGLCPRHARRLTERAMSEAAAGRIRPIIGQTFPLEQAADAHLAIEARDVIGKTLLVI